MNSPPPPSPPDESGPVLRVRTPPTVRLEAKTGQDDGGREEVVLDTGGWSCPTAYDVFLLGVG
jgi:hypothetical protein